MQEHTCYDLPSRSDLWLVCWLCFHATQPMWPCAANVTLCSYGFCFSVSKNIVLSIQYSLHWILLFTKNLEKINIYFSRVLCILPVTFSEYHEFSLVNVCEKSFNIEQIENDVQKVCKNLTLHDIYTVRIFCFACVSFYTCLSRIVQEWTDAKLANRLWQAPRMHEIVLTSCVTIVMNSAHWQNWIPVQNMHFINDLVNCE